MPEPLPRAPLTPPGMAPGSAPPPPGMRHPTFSPAPYPPPGRQRRWPTIVAIALATGAVTATVTALITTQLAHHADSASTHAPGATVTVTTAPSAAPTPAPLPTAEADRKTCTAWHAAGDKMHEASHAQSVIPKEMTVLSQQVRDNPDWSAAVRKAADLYGQAGDTLAAGIAPGTTVVLSQAAASAADALHTISTAYRTFDAAGGNAYHVMHESSDEVDVLCERLAPR
jgi:hypothetical protein